MLPYFVTGLVAGAVCAALWPEQTKRVTREAKKWVPVEPPAPGVDPAGTHDPQARRPPARRFTRAEA